MKISYFLLLLGTGFSLPLAAANLGGVNLNAQCARQAQGTRAVLVDENGRVTGQHLAPNRAYGWRCQGKNGSLQSMNLDAACTAQHGAGAKAEVGNKDDAKSWRCTRTDAQPPGIASGSRIEYKNFGGQAEQLHVYVGKRAVVLVPQALQQDEAGKIVGMIDQCAAVYADMSGSGWPRNTLAQFPGKASVALVRKTCGAGCGAGGKAEIVVKEFAEGVARVKSTTHPLTWQVGFYELGRGGSSQNNPSFPFFPALDPSNRHDVVASAFPEFVMSTCIDRLGITPAAYEQSHKSVGYPRGPGVVEFGRRFRNSKYTFVQAYEKDRDGFYRGWALSSLLFDLYQKFGYDKMKLFMANLATLARESGQVRTHGAVAKNLLEAARRSGGEEMISYLRKTWRVD